MIGLLWLPFIKRLGRNKYNFFLAITVGLLLFLGIDAIEEALEVSKENLADSFNGVLLVSTVLVVSFLGLYYSGEILIKKSRKVILHQTCGNRIDDCNRHRIT